VTREYSASRIPATGAAPSSKDFGQFLDHGLVAPGVTVAAIDFDLARFGRGIDEVHFQSPRPHARIPDDIPS
jgi:hypothetical protein